MQAEQQICIMLVGNKLDLVTENPSKRQVSSEEARRMCANHPNMRHIETSAYNRSNVNDAFELLLNEIYTSRQNMPLNYQKNPLKIYDGDQNDKDKGCCSWFYSSSLKQLLMIEGEGKCLDLWSNWKTST